MLHSVAVESGCDDSIHAWIVNSIPNILMILHMSLAIKEKFPAFCIPLKTNRTLGASINLSVL